jgi:hypothetical protein
MLFRVGNYYLSKNILSLVYTTAGFCYTICYIADSTREGVYLNAEDE